MASLPRISVCVWNYDRTQALLDGRVKINGFDCSYAVLDPEKAYAKTFGEAAFDVVEMSLSYHLTALAKGSALYDAIPVYPSRAFRHSTIYIRTDRQIQTPADISGKRVGLQDYDMTAALAVRAFLRSDYGVDARDIQWCVGDEITIRSEPRATRSVAGVKVEHLTRCSLDEALSGGYLDALICLRAPPCFVSGDKNIQRLFPDFVAAERDYFVRTGVFPIMHVVGIRKPLAARFPNLPRALCQAFDDAKAMAVRELELCSWVPKVSVPWIAADFEETRKLFGGDVWPYGIDANRKTLEAMIAFHREEGLCHRVLSVDELFPFNV